MRFQFIEIRIVGQVKTEVFGTAEGIQVSKYGIAADRLNIEAGGGVDKFGQPILNRVVLVKSAN